MASPSKRNKVVGGWELNPYDAEPVRQVTNYGGESHWVIRTEVADLHDTVCDTVYRHGAYRVTIDGPSPKPRGKTFVGETAWSDAERYANDVYWGLRRN